MLSHRIGKNSETTKHDIQTKTIETDMAFPLTLLGNISAINTHVTGPKDIANAPIKVNMKINFHIPSQFIKKAIDNNKREIAIIIEP